MILDLEESKPKLNKFKVCVCAIILILLLSIPIIFVIKNNQNNKLYSGIDNYELNEIENEIVENESLEFKDELPKATLTTNGINAIKNIYETDEKVAYITFDDGPSKTVTPLILDVLKQEDVKVSFFVLGSRVELYPEIVKQEYEDGHYIANHGYSHNYSSIYAYPQAVLDEYFNAQNAIRQAIGINDYNCNIFRFPGGSNGGKYASVKNEAKTLLESNNIAYIDWNALTNDATGENLTKEQMFEKLVGTVNGKNSVVILMHDAGDKILTYELLPQIIQYLRDEGYTFKNFYNIIQ